jgi:hypothetical protein
VSNLLDEVRELIDRAAGLLTASVDSARGRDATELCNQAISLAADLPPDVTECQTAFAKRAGTARCRS